MESITDESLHSVFTMLPIFSGQHYIVDIFRSSEVRCSASKFVAGPGARGSTGAVDAMRALLWAWAPWRFSRSPEAPKIVSSMWMSLEFSNLANP